MPKVLPAELLAADLGLENAENDHDVMGSIHAAVSHSVPLRPLLTEACLKPDFSRADREAEACQSHLGAEWCEH